MKIMILRGISGSGKSHFAEECLEKLGSVVVSADFFFLSPSGKYTFDVSKLAEAHADCLRRFIRFCDEAREGWSPALTLVVDNTNLTAIEIAPYYQIALAYGHEPEIVEFDCDPRIAFARNCHKVPFNVHTAQVTKMRSALPSFWKRRTIRIETCSCGHPFESHDQEITPFTPLVCSSNGCACQSFYPFKRETFE